jgi:hypothetical protein
MDSTYRYNQGILDPEDADFIKEKKLGVSEIAGYTNGNYSVFSDLNIYKIYEKEEVRNNIQNILHSAILGRIKSINMFGNVYYFPGNLPRFIIDYDIEFSVEELYASFICFLELSMLIDSRND